jgi:hypothetical protein
MSPSIHATSLSEDFNAGCSAGFFLGLTRSTITISLARGKCVGLNFALTGQP